MTVRILIGDVRAQLRELADDSVDCVVTSPPYWGLRDYGTAAWVGGDPACDHRSPTMKAGRDEQRPTLAGTAATNSAQLLLAHRSACGKCGAVKVDHQIGLEPTLAEHLAVMVEVCREIRRVLKPRGTFWLNYGDCYATAPNGRSAADTKVDGADDRTFRDKPFSTVGAGFKAKDLLMIPNRLAIALCDDGWYVRAECIWGKTNPMPDSSGAQRPATAHEKVFLLTKSADADVWRARDTKELSLNPDLSERCPLVTKPHVMAARWVRIGSYYDAEAVLQGRSSDEDANGFRGGSYVNGVPGPRAMTGNVRKVIGRRDYKTPDGWDTTVGEGGHGSIAKPGRFKGEPAAAKKAKRRAADVAAPRHVGHINHTGIEDTPRGEGRYLRNYEPAPLTVWEMAIMPFKGAHFATFPPELAARCLKAGCPAGGTVLDPFGGAGTVGLVAESTGLDSTLIELNPEYAEIAANRIRAAAVKNTVVGVEHQDKHSDTPLFGSVAA